MNPNAVHRITRGQIEHILRCLRSIDRVGEELTGTSNSQADLIADLKGCQIESTSW